MDQECYDTLSLLALPEVGPIPLADLEAEDVELPGARQNRTRVEYYFTCTPSLPLYILKHHPEVDLITYLDADLFFFSDLTPIYDEIADHSVAMIGHRFLPEEKYREKYGIYNVGWLSFRRDENAFSCLRWWRERCIEWCYDRCEDGRFADQKYLDTWPGLFENVVVLQHKGANLAPWNVANYTMRAAGSRIMVDDQPLVFYHFHGFKQVSGWVYDLNLPPHLSKMAVRVLRGIYITYLRELLGINRRLPGRPVANALERPSAVGKARRFLDGTPQGKLLIGKIRANLRIFKGIVTRRYILALNKSDDMIF